MAYTTIDKGSKYFDVKLRQGFGSSGGTVTGLSFKPEMFWEKNRTSTTGSGTYVYDVVRGVYKFIRTNLTDAEASNTNLMTSFNSDGFTLGSADYATDQSLVAWCWSAGNSTGVSNTQGTLTATVSANTTSGFSICKITEASSYSGTQTFGHGLGVAPSMVIYRQQNTTSNWQVYHKATGTGITQLNNTNAVNTSASFFPAVSSTTVSIGEGIQAPTYTSIAYCFAEVKGFSKAFSYTGNGSTDGTFVYCGFKPAFVLAKRATTAGENWTIYDNKRNDYNPVLKLLYPDSNGAEASAPNTYDFLSNGFKLRSSDGRENLSGATFIGIAFAENPFVSSKGVPVCAR